MKYIVIFLISLIALTGCSKEPTYTQVLNEWLEQRDTQKIDELTLDIQEATANITQAANKNRELERLLSDTIEKATTEKVALQARLDAAPTQEQTDDLRDAMNGYSIRLEAAIKNYSTLDTLYCKLYHNNLILQRDYEIIWKRIKAVDNKTHIAVADNLTSPFYLIWQEWRETIPDEID